jgi:hypothetical protein
MLVTRVPGHHIYRTKLYDDHSLHLFSHKRGWIKAPSFDINPDTEQPHNTYLLPTNWEAI